MAGEKIFRFLGRTKVYHFFTTGRFFFDFELKMRSRVVYWALVSQKVLLGFSGQKRGSIIMDLLSPRGMKGKINIYSSILY